RRRRSAKTTRCPSARSSSGSRYRRSAGGWRGRATRRPPSLTRGRGRGCREGEAEGASLPRLALHPDAAAVRLHDAACDRESQSDAFALAVSLPEALEDVFDVVARDAG